MTTKPLTTGAATTENIRAAKLSKSQLRALAALVEAQTISWSYTNGKTTCSVAGVAYTSFNKLIKAGLAVAGEADEGEGVTAWSVSLAPTFGF